MEDLTKLYSKVIKAHNDAPFHFEKRTGADTVVKAYNPICGDRFEIYIDLADDKIKSLHFYGFGCAISKASTSVLTRSLEGKSVNEAIATCELFIRFLNSKLKDNEIALSDEFLAFAGVHDFPERYDCASLSWVEVKRFLQALS